ncbi:hypothetical protein [Kytococcus sedentarius]|uniref:hypothetical protein n=1 Tax=Kytococcus sedentarius TaxID=1276 RepID=UPI0035BBBFE4
MVGVLLGSGMGVVASGDGSLGACSLVLEGAEGRGSGVAVSPGAGELVGSGAVLVEELGAVVLGLVGALDAEEDVLGLEDALEELLALDPVGSGDEDGEGDSPEASPSDSCEDAATTGECSSSGNSSSPNHPARAPASTTPPAPTRPRPAKVAVLFCMVPPRGSCRWIWLPSLTSPARCRNARGTVHGDRERPVNLP